MGEQTVKVNSLFKQNETPTISKYIERCGVISFEEYQNPASKWIESPYRYFNMDAAVQLLEEAIKATKEQDKSIYIVCDCDCDGYCATTIAYQFLMKCGVDNKNIIPLLHTGKQHGLSKDIMLQCNQNGYNLDNVCLIWVPDAGTNDYIQSSFLKRIMGIPVLVTDHHEQTENNNDAVIVNNQIGTDVLNCYLCGAGVTHKVITAYCNKHDLKFHQEFLDLVALATIGDVMDMRLFENRLIVKWGINHIKNPLLRAMCTEFISDGDINPTSLAWNVVPKINAVCRSEDSDLKAYLLYGMVDYDNADPTQDELIPLLKQCHAKQGEESKRLYEEALKQKPIGDKVKIFVLENTPYTGLVAMKLSDHFNCPCMVVHESDEQYIGSLRSPCPMRTQLEKSCLMTICAGHEASCGVGWWKEDTDELSSYCRHLDLQPAIKQVMYSTDNVLIQPEIFEITELGKEYWGTGIPEPLIHISGITINGQEIKEIGANKTTIKFLYGDIEFIMFFASKEKKERMNVGKPINMEMEVIGTPTINRFRDKETKQIVIKEWEIK